LHFSNTSLSERQLAPIKVFHFNDNLKEIDKNKLKKKKKIYKFKKKKKKIKKKKIKKKKK